MRDMFFGKWKVFEDEKPPKPGLYLMRFVYNRKIYMQVRRWDGKFFNAIRGYGCTHWMHIKFPTEQEGETYNG